jgi:plasmid stabilization system protein ParE
MKIRLMKAAITDLREAQAYIALENPAAAKQVVIRIQRAVELIATRSEIGRPSEDRMTREWSVPGLPYMIPYRIVGDVIEIVRIWHTSRERPQTW